MLFERGLNPLGRAVALQIVHDLEVIMFDRLLPRNESTLDRGVRVVLGLGLLATTVVGPQSMLGLVGLVPLITGLLGSCPIYTMLGVGTCPLPPR